MNYYTKKVFPISYYHTNISETKELKKKFVPEIVKNYSINPPKSWETAKINTSFNKKDLNDIVFGENNKEFPYQIYMSYIDKFFDLSWKGEIQDLWYNCYIDKDYQERHNHTNISGPLNPQFSCIHYLSFNSERHQPTKFYDPLGNLRSSSFEFQSNKYENSFIPRTREGDFLMFPSYLEHSVMPSQETEDYPRVTISFNLFVYEYGEKL